MNEDHGNHTSSSSSEQEPEHQKEVLNELSGKEYENNTTKITTSQSEQPLAIPQKRPVGRPRKHPLPPNYTPPVRNTTQKTRTASTIYDELESQGVTAKDIQKYLLKKKVKKYVQQYVQKYQPPTALPRQQERSYNRNYYDVDADEEEGFQEIEESSEGEQGEEINSLSTPRTGAIDSIRQREHANQQKGNHLLVQSSKKMYSQPRYSGYRY